MSQDKVKHLEFIQNVIIRISGKSFEVKKWTISIMTGGMVLFVNDGNVYVLVILLLTDIMMWYLDATYLQIEKRYRSLYEKVALVDNIVLFNMDASHEKVDNILEVMSSKTLSCIYGIISILIIFIILIKSGIFKIIMDYLTV